jgi:hypothetical protein
VGLESMGQADELTMGSSYGDQRPETEIPEDWHVPQPETLPEPSYWPFVLAVGIILTFWGVVTSFVISLVGIVVIAAALAGWIGELRHEHAA